MNANSRPAFVRSDLPRYAPQAGLVLLLGVEVLALTVGFDTEHLTRVPSAWAHFVGWTPQLFRLTLACGCATLLIVLAGNPAAFRGVTSSAPRPFRAHLLALHAIALLAFVRISIVVINGQSPFLAEPADWTVAWLFAGLLTIAAWCVALVPLDTWRSFGRQQRFSILWGFAAGTATWGCGFFSQALWTSLARYTFALVAWILRFIYPAVVSDPQRMIIGTRTFKAIITPQCSGYEGVGLVVAFLSVYLWLFRKELRFPAALLLLPLGALTIWIVNAFRIVALIAIGTSGWKAVATGGFHSQAGWIAFNVIALAFVAATMRFRYFAREAESVSRPAAPPRTEPDATTAYLAPFLAVTATAMLTGALSGGFEWFYPLRLVAVIAVWWTWRKSYLRLTWTWSWWPIAMGMAAFVAWLVLMPSTASGNQGWPAALRSVPWYWASAWLLFRTVGYVVTAPLAEELAFRGFLVRRLVRADFDNVPVGIFTWASFLISSVVFGALHGSLWLPGTVAGMLFALAVSRRGALGDAVQAHATTNGLLALYAFATGHWWAWS